MNAELAKYAELYGKLDIVTGISQSDGGSFLLSGEDGDGLALTARLVAARLCGVAFEKALEEHADIIVYPNPQRSKTSSKKTAEKSKPPMVSVDDVREIIDSLYLTPFELGKRIYIIENAESMSEICQNKLLKSLEEPPSRVCFILCACGTMLPTVQSRCRLLRLAPFPVDVVRRELDLRHKDKSANELAARASRGNIGLAERILGDGDFSKLYSAALDILRLASGSRRFAETAAVYDKLTRDKVATLLGIMEYLLCDIARALVGAETVFPSGDVTGVSDGFTPLSAANGADFVRIAKRHNEANCIPQAVMDELVLKIMEEKALCRR